MKWFKRFTLFDLVDWGFFLIQLSCVIGAISISVMMFSTGWWVLGLILLALLTGLILYIINTINVITDSRVSRLKKTGTW